MAPSRGVLEEAKGLKMDLRFQDEAEVKAQSKILHRMEDPAVRIKPRPLQQRDNELEHHPPQDPHQDLPPWVAPPQGPEEGIVVLFAKAFSFEPLRQPPRQPLQDPDHRKAPLGAEPEPYAFGGWRTPKEQVLAAATLWPSLFTQQRYGRPQIPPVEEDHRRPLLDKEGHYRTFHRDISHDYYPTDQPRRDPPRSLPRLGHQHRRAISPHRDPLLLQQIEGPARP